jgi:hypothetical protein
MQSVNCIGFGACQCQVYPLRLHESWNVILCISFHVSTIFMTLFAIFLVLNMFVSLILSLPWSELRQVSLYQSKGCSENYGSLVCLFVFVCCQGSRLFWFCKFLNKWTEISWNIVSSIKHTNKWINLILLWLKDKNIAWITLSLSRLLREKAFGSKMHQIIYPMHITNKHRQIWF